MDISGTVLECAGKRIKERRRNMGMTQSELAELVSLSPASVSKYENGLVPDAGLKVFTEFAKALRMPVWQLLGMSEDSAESGAKKVPILGKSAAGIPIFATPEHNEYASVEAEDNVDFAVRIEGDSMINARIYDGDLVFAKEQKSVSNGEIAVVQIEEGPEDYYVTTKRFYKYGGSVVLRSENPAYKDIEITKKSGSSVEVLGKVVFLKGRVY